MSKSLFRAIDEQTSAADLLRDGHPDRNGLELAIDDWVKEEVLIREEEKP